MNFVSGMLIRFMSIFPWVRLLRSFPNTRSKLPWSTNRVRSLRQCLSFPKFPLFTLNCKEIKPVSPKGNQAWIFVGRTDVEGEAPILWPPDAKRRLIGKDPDAGKDWRQEEKGAAEDKMVGLHHRLSGHEFEQTPGDSGGQKSLLRCSPMGHQELVRYDLATGKQ